MKIIIMLILISSLLFLIGCTFKSDFGGVGTCYFDGGTSYVIDFITQCRDHYPNTSNFRENELTLDCCWSIITKDDILGFQTNEICKGIITNKTTFTEQHKVVGVTKRWCIP